MMELVPTSPGLSREVLRRPTPSSGSDGDALATIWLEAAKHLSWPSLNTHEPVERELERLAGEWRCETALLSSVTDIVAHPAYQRIIGIGREAVPFLLHQLQLEPRQWFHALASITGVDPVPSGDRGKVRRMAEAWIAWGREKGII